MNNDRIAGAAVYTGEGLMFEKGEHLWVYPLDEDRYCVFANKDCTGWIGNISRSKARLTDIVPSTSYLININRAIKDKIE